MARNRSISSIIGNKPTKRPSQSKLTRKKGDNKVPCYCNQCNGKLVLKRTKLFHESAGGSTTIQDPGKQLSAELLAHDAGSPQHLESETGLPALGTETGSPALGTETGLPALGTETGLPALGTELHSLIPRSSVPNFRIGSGSDQAKIRTRPDPIRIRKKLSRDPV